MACLLSDPSFLQDRKAMADALELSLPPLIQEFCQDCGQHHSIETGDMGDNRYGLPPVDVVRKDKKLETWAPRNYCQVCHAYHNKDNRCAGAREVEDWEGKVI